MSIQSSVKYAWDANGVLPADHRVFEKIVGRRRLGRPGAIVWDIDNIPPEMIEAGWEMLLQADWENLTPADVEEILIVALRTRLP